MSTSECRSVVIFFWFKVIGKIASSHLGRRDEGGRGGQRDQSPDGHMVRDHTLAHFSLPPEATSPFLFLVYLHFSLFFCLFYLPVSLFKTSLYEDEQEN